MTERRTHQAPAADGWERPAYLPPLPTIAVIEDFVPGSTPPVAPVAFDDAVERLAIPQEGLATPTAAASTPESAGTTTAARQRTAREQSGSRERGDRVVLRGNIGQTPQFGTTPKGQPRLFFPLGLHPDAETTVWKRILVFGRRAEQLSETLSKGDQVEVIGYLHHNQSYSKKAGGLVPVDEIYGTAVRK